jgi:hypothetical protein
VPPILTNARVNEVVSVSMSQSVRVVYDD